MAKHTRTPPDAHETIEFQNLLRSQQDTKNWGTELVPERFRIDPRREYRTRRGKRVLGLRIEMTNGFGHEVTCPVKGSIVVREKPQKLAYAIWTLDGRKYVLDGDYRDDLVPAESERTPTLFELIEPRDRVTIVTPQGQEQTGRVVMRGPAGWVLDLGGRHGTPGIASPENVVRVRKSPTRPSGGERWLSGS